MRFTTTTIVITLLSLFTTGIQSAPVVLPTATDNVDTPTNVATPTITPAPTVTVGQEYAMKPRGLGKEEPSYVFLGNENIRSSLLNRLTMDLP
ncbi:hypothetical protein HDU76_004436 [Blyttiomyces sp. JEL0837]|nr:hypothetical protein HDU76_004436 [Blyttiomyces sp. JEL0837]